LYLGKILSGVENEEVEKEEVFKGDGRVAVVVVVVVVDDDNDDERCTFPEAKIDVSI